LIDITSSLYNTIAKLLFRTYPFYNDRPSRRAVQRCIRSLFASASAEEAQATFIQLLQDESSKPGIASTNAFVLVEWCSILLQDLTSSPEKLKRWATEIMCANARALDTCAVSTTRRTVGHSAIIVTRRALRKVFSEGEIGQQMLKQIILLLTASRTGCRENAVFLGVIAGVSARIPKARVNFGEHKKVIYAFYAKEIIGSRTTIPLHVAEGLHDFFHSFCTSEDVLKEVVPSLEKALLRSPEIVLNGLIPPFVQALPEEIDLSETLNTRLLKPLLTNVKSTNAGIRSGAIVAFENVVSRCHDSTWLATSAEEILLPLKTAKVPNADHRVLHAQMLAAIPLSENVSLAIVRGLTAASAKEASEIALVAETTALGKHLACVIREGVTIENTVFDTVAKGCGDKRNPFRKAWITSIGDVFWNIDEAHLSNPQLSKACIPILTKMSEIFEEIVANPLPFIQGGLVTMGYVFTALSQSKHNAICNGAGAALADSGKISQRALTVLPKPSFLLNPRVYTKLTSAKDISWILRALTGVSGKLSSDSSDSASNDAWSQALLFFLTATDVPPEARQESARTLSQAYRSSPAKIGRIVISGIWQWIQTVEQGDKDSPAIAAKTGLNNLNLAVKAITPSTNGSKDEKPTDSVHGIQDQVIALLVLCQPSLLSRVRWIDVALQSGVDPGSLAKQRSEDCITEIIINTEVSCLDNCWPKVLKMTEYQGSPQAQFDDVKSAAYQAAAELAFVAPESMVPEIVKQIESDLDVAQITNLGPTEAAIARTPEGVAFVDVLSAAGKNHLSDKNIKDYDTLKWEEELKAQIAKKKGQQRKLTADETAKVNAQLAKESSIRKQVLKVESRIKRGAGMAKNLAEGPPTDAGAWLNQVLRVLLEMARNDAGLFVGDAVSAAVISCSATITPRLGTLRPFIGVATLRALGNSYLSPEYVQEPLGGIRLLP
jgi:hypothetical protein